ncbi:MAG: crAss001_48 related protein [Oscillospiraceae bacterium]
MELKDTVALMESDDYKDRFKVEYYQTKIRYEKLHKMLIKIEAGTLGFQLKCPSHLLREQENDMRDYLKILEIRAEHEGIGL